VGVGEITLTGPNQRGARAWCLSVEQARQTLSNYCGDFCRRRSIKRTIVLFGGVRGVMLRDIMVTLCMVALAVCVGCCCFLLLQQPVCPGRRRVSFRNLGCLYAPRGSGGWSVYGCVATWKISPRGEGGGYKISIVRFIV
jgi:hypothetical protein